ncbi:unnamed protein product [Rotaria sp. Silwood1]|nr:unnamed protein product [Rotaria sp. Silwood1]CAF4975571.1 unnamed protein product [Rotaria sp. Silwood1]
MASTELMISEKVLRLTSQEMVDVIYDTLEVVDEILRSAKIEYTLFCGTMLGSQRHGGLIPWDDDGDIAILRNDEQKLLTLKETFANRGLILGVEPLFGYRVWDPRRTVFQVRHQLYVPFVDIFLIDTDVNQYIYITEEAKKMFPYEPLPFGCFQRLVDVPFGHLTLRGLNSDDTQQHLNENFGSDWNQVAWRDYDHLTGEILPKICIALDDPNLLRPALHSQHNDIKPSPSVSTMKSTDVQNDRSDS